MEADLSRPRNRFAPQAGGFPGGCSCECGCANTRAMNTPFLNRYVRVRVTAKLESAWVKVKFALGICFGSCHDSWIGRGYPRGHWLLVTALGDSEFPSNGFFWEETCPQRLPDGGWKLKHRGFSLHTPVFKLEPELGSTWSLLKVDYWDPLPTLGFYFHRSRVGPKNLHLY